MTTKRKQRPTISLGSSNGAATIAVRLTLESDRYRWDAARLMLAIETFMATVESCVMLVDQEARDDRA